MIRPRCTRRSRRSARAIRSAGLDPEERRTGAAGRRHVAHPARRPDGARGAGRPVAVDTHPKHAMALGAAFVAESHRQAAAGRARGGDGRWGCACGRGRRARNVRGAIPPAVDETVRVPVPLAAETSGAPAPDPPSGGARISAGPAGARRAAARAKRCRGRGRRRDRPRRVRDPGRRGVLVALPSWPSRARRRPSRRRVAIDPADAERHPDPTPWRAHARADTDPDPSWTTGPDPRHRDERGTVRGRLRGLQLQAGGWPGRHVHFYFDTVEPSQAGVPGKGPWILYAGPIPFKGYKVSDRPAAATKMCVLVANMDHSVIQGTGNCVDLPT